MPRVLTLCPRTAVVIDTGLSLPLDAPLGKLAKTRVHCHRCDSTHGIRRPFFEGHGPSEFHKYIVALDAEPNFAAEVGVLISLFALVEMYMPRLMAKITGLDEEMAFTILSRFAKFSDRIDLLKSLSKIQPKTHARDKGLLQKLLPRIRHINTLRNKYAHATYGITFDDDYMVTAFQSSGKPKETRKSLHDVVADVNTFKHLICDLHGYVYRDEEPPAWP